MLGMTITLSDEVHQTLKETSIHQHRTITASIEESLKFRGIKTLDNASALVQLARARGNLKEDDALTLAVEETLKSRCYPAREMSLPTITVDTNVVMRVLQEAQMISTSYFFTILSTVSNTIRSDSAWAIIILSKGSL